MCKKQTSVSHSSTESEIISLDAGLKLDGVPALDLWNLIVTVLHGNTNESKQVQGNLSTSLTRKKIPGKIDDLNTVDFVSSNANSFRQEAMLYILLFDRINLDRKIQIKYIDTKNQLAAILTKGNFTRDEWNHLLCLFNSSHFSPINSVKAMSKRTQEGAGEERDTSKSRPMMNLVSRCRIRDPTVLASTASENPENTKSESQKVPLSSLNVQQTGTVKPVILDSLSNSSEWNNDDKWSSQVRKSGEMSNTSAGKLVSNKLVINIDMDSDTTAESDLSFKSSSFLNKANDRLRKMLNRYPEDSMQDIKKRSWIWWMFLSSTLQASVFMGENYSDNLHSIKNT